MIAVASYYGAAAFAVLALLMARASGGKSAIPKGGRALGWMIAAGLLLLISARAVASPDVGSAAMVGGGQAAWAALWFLPPRVRGWPILTAYFLALGGLLSSVAIVLYLAR